MLTYSSLTYQLARRALHRRGRGQPRNQLAMNYRPLVRLADLGRRRSLLSTERRAVRRGGAVLARRPARRAQTLN